MVSPRKLPFSSNHKSHLILSRKAIPLRLGHQRSSARVDIHQISRSYLRPQSSRLRNRVIALDIRSYKHKRRALLTNARERVTGSWRLTIQNARSKDVSSPVKFSIRPEVNSPPIALPIYYSILTPDTDYCPKNIISDRAAGTRR